MNEAVEVRGLNFPRTSSVDDYLLYLEYNYSAQYDELLLQIKELGLDTGDMWFNPQSTLMMLASGLIKPILVTGSDEEQYFFFLQWSPSEAEYVEWGTLDDYDLHWYVQCYEILCSRS